MRQKKKGSVAAFFVSWTAFVPSTIANSTLCHARRRRATIGDDQRRHPQT